MNAMWGLQASPYRYRWEFDEFDDFHQKSIHTIHQKSIHTIHQKSIHTIHQQ
jgi:hypothetical protein